MLQTKDNRQRVEEPSKKWSNNQTVISSIYFNNTRRMTLCSIFSTKTCANFWSKTYSSVFWTSQKVNGCGSNTKYINFSEVTKKKKICFYFWTPTAQINFVLTALTSKKFFLVNYSNFFPNIYKCPGSSWHTFFQEILHISSSFLWH